MRALWRCMGSLCSLLRRLARTPRRRIRYRKYRVAPWLGTNTVRLRLLSGLKASAALTATRTHVA